MANAAKKFSPHPDITAQPDPSMTDSRMVFSRAAASPPTDSGREASQRVNHLEIADMAGA
jgi:hypothetical protein